MVICGQTKLKKMEHKYEYLEEVGFELHDRLHRKEKEKTTRIFYDNALEKDEVEMKKISSLNHSRENILKFRILRISDNVSILNAIASFCRNIDPVSKEVFCEDIPFKMIAFDTLDTVIDVAETYKEMLSKDAKTNIFVFGSKPDFYIARVHNGINGISAYVGKKNFELPLYARNEHHIFGIV